MVKLEETFRAKYQRLNNAEIIERPWTLYFKVESPNFSLPDGKVEDTNYFICTDSAIARLLQSAHHHNSAFIRITQSLDNDGAIRTRTLCASGM